MTTTLHRFTLTETPELAHAIDVALTSFDELENDRPAALRRIVEIGSRAIERERERTIARRRAAIRKYAGSLPDTFPENAAQALKDEWPE